MTTAPVIVSGLKTAKIIKNLIFGALLSLGEGHDGPTGVKNTSAQCARMGRIHIMCLVPSGGLYDTPGAPNRACFGPRVPFWGPEAELLPGRWCHPGLTLIL